MSRRLRILLSLISVAQLLFAAAFFVQWPPAISLWPLAGTTPLTYILLAAFFAAAAVSTLWPIATDRDGALAGVGLDYLIILTPLSALFFVLAGRGQSGLLIYAVLLAGGAGIARLTGNLCMPRCWSWWACAMQFASLVTVGLQARIKAATITPTSSGKRCACSSP